MVDLVRLIFDKNGGLLIILAVMLLAIYGSHNFANEEREKLASIDKEERDKLTQNVKENTKAIFLNSETIHKLDKEISVHIAKE